MLSIQGEIRIDAWSFHCQYQILLQLHTQENPAAMIIIDTFDSKELLEHKGKFKRLIKCVCGIFVFKRQEFY